MGFTPEPPDPKPLLSYGSVTPVPSSKGSTQRVGCSDEICLLENLAQG